MPIEGTLYILEAVWVQKQSQAYGLQTARQRVQPHGVSCRYGFTRVIKGVHENGIMASGAIFNFLGFTKDAYV